MPRFPGGPGGKRGNGPCRGGGGVQLVPAASEARRVGLLWGGGGRGNMAWWSLACSGERCAPPGVLSHHAIDELQQDGGLGRGQEAGDGEEEVDERELPLARERLEARRREGGAAVRRRRGQASANVAEPRRHRGRLSAWLQRPPGRAPPPRSVAPAGDISGVVAGGGKEGGLGLALAPPLCSRTGSPCSV